MTQRLTIHSFVLDRRPMSTTAVRTLVPGEMYLERDAAGIMRLVCDVDLPEAMMAVMLVVLDGQSAP